MSMPIDKLLDENKGRYEQCVAAMKIAQHMSDTYTAEDEDSEKKEKLAVHSIRRLLEGDVEISTGIEDADFDE